MQWLNDSAGNPLAFWQQGKGWNAGQNWSHQVGGKLSGTNLALDSTYGAGDSLINAFYKQQRDAQLANTDGYVLGSATPYNTHSTALEGIDASGLTDLQKQMLDPNSRWGSQGFETVGNLVV